MIDWIHRTLQTPAVELSEDEIVDDYDPNVMHDTESYWTCLYRLLLQGRLYEALQLLQSCEELVGSDSEYADVMVRICNAIETNPAIAWRDRIQTQSNPSTAHLPLDQFLHSLTEWRNEVRDILEDDIFVEKPHVHVELLLQILLGDDASMLQCAGVNYLEYFLGTILYVQPHLHVTKSEMSQILARCMEQCEQQWKNEKEAMSEDGTNQEVDEDETLYTPIDTLRYHLISSDITTSLNIMNSMLDLKFFMAHVANLLDQHGEILHLEPNSGKDDTHGLPLRLNDSSVNSKITLKEYYLITYGESLESNSFNPISAPNGEVISNTGDLWQLAAEYYAACYENGYGYLRNLIQRQMITFTTTIKTGDAMHDETDSSHSGTVEMVSTPKIHKLLSLASKYEMTREYTDILLMAGSVCTRLGRDALRAGKENTFFGQAAFWYAMIPVNGEVTNTGESEPTSTSVAPVTKLKLEALVEIIFDEIFLNQSNPSSPSSRQLAISFESLRGVLSHTPVSLLHPLESFELDHQQHLRPSASPLLTFASLYHQYRLFDTRRRMLVREILDLTTRMATETNVPASSPDEANMADVHDSTPIDSTPRHAQLAQLIAQQEYCKGESLLILTLVLRHAPVLLPNHRKYWLVLITQLVDLADARTSTKQVELTDSTSTITAATSTPIPAISWFDLQHPAVSLPSPLPSVPSPLNLNTLTHIQRLMTTITLASTHQAYAKVIGGENSTKRLQARLSELTQATIRTKTF